VPLSTFTPPCSTPTTAERTRYVRKGALKLGEHKLLKAETASGRDTRVHERTFGRFLYQSETSFATFGGAATSAAFAPSAALAALDLRPPSAPSSVTTPPLPLPLPLPFFFLSNCLPPPRFSHSACFSS
jgi:hypothetical protein